MTTVVAREYTSTRAGQSKSGCTSYMLILFVTAFPRHRLGRRWFHFIIPSPPFVSTRHPFRVTLFPTTSTIGLQAVSPPNVTQLHFAPIPFHFPVWQPSIVSKHQLEWIDSVNDIHAHKFLISRRPTQSIPYPSCS